MTEQEFDLIESFWLGKLSPEEKAAFEQRLQSDVAFRQQVEIFSVLRKGIKGYGRNELRRKLFLPAEIPFMVRLGKTYKYGAFALPFILIATVFLWMPSGNEKLYKEFYAKADTITLIGRTAGARPGQCRSK